MAPKIKTLLSMSSENLMIIYRIVKNYFTTRLPFSRIPVIFTAQNAD